MNVKIDQTASELIDGLAIKFTTEAPFVSVIVAVEDDNGLGNKNGYGLQQTQPNPFSDFTSINYSLPSESNVVLQIFDIRGQLVRSFFTQKQTAGKHSLQWHGDNDAGISLNSGIYIIRLQTENISDTRKVFMLK